MDFITGLPRSQNQCDSIWVIIDRITKSIHFLPMRTNYSMEDYSKLYLAEIMKLHSAPVLIISNQDLLLSSHFSKSFQKGLGTKVCLSIYFHPQIDGQVEKSIQTLEDMLQACVIDYSGSWYDHLSLIKFDYNNSYHSRIGMAPFKALYGRRC